MQILLSLPQALLNSRESLASRPLSQWVLGGDPPERPLGTGGSTVQLLHEAYEKSGAAVDFSTWLASDRRMVIHAGGPARQLPAYAPGSKPLLPLPVFRWSKGQRLDQTLLDLQLPLLTQILDAAPPQSRVLVAAGDVLVRMNGPLPRLPEADVVCLGLWVEPSAASHHGVFFLPRRGPDRLRFFLQKPSPQRISELAGEHLFLVDTGLWLLSEKAVRSLEEKRPRIGTDQTRMNSAFGLYSDFGMSLGSEPTVWDDDISRLSVAVVPLTGGEFYHFGSNRDLIRSCLRLQNVVLDQRALSVNTVKLHPEMFVQNSKLEFPLEAHHQTVWIENSHLPATWTLEGRHIITGVPQNDWTLHLPGGMCLDAVPIGESSWCLRFYHLDDTFTGSVSDPGTRWCGGSVGDWFAARGLTMDAQGDIQDAMLFPVVELDAIDGSFVQWLVGGGRPRINTDQTRIYAARRMSASQLWREANVARLFAQRDAMRRETLLPLVRNAARSVFYQLDLVHTAKEYAAAGYPLPEEEPADAPLMRRVCQRMFCANVLRNAKRPRIDTDQTRTTPDSLEHSAFQLLAEAMIADTRERKVAPTKNILDDQIIWARSPVRLDLAGGWTDTPPYCLLHGGSVVNVGVNLNGQPPIQVFVRLAERPQIVLRSIDLGVEERVTDYDELRRCGEVGSGFSIARAALALAGFLPEFSAFSQHASLESQLREFGGGIEISLLAAVPKGSGLGTSSILAATLLGALGELGGLNWDTAEICRRTLTLEQMLTTGGGWQDQIGGLARGLKLIETQPGLHQDLVVRWLPAHLFEDAEPKSCMLLYYTGITRVAKNILAEIVRGMFLNSGQHLATLEQLGAHARDTYEVLLRGQWDGLCRSIARSWQLNQQLDGGTNPREVQSILARVEDQLAAMKLLGAGGGGYMLMLAKDPQAAARIRHTLTASPPNSKARFVEFEVSKTGLEITRS